MSAPFIEHVNLRVRDPARSAELMRRLFDWHIRWQGPARDDGYTIHVGDKRFYIALYGAVEPRAPNAHYEMGQPLNHIGIVVDDLDDLERRVIAIGLDPYSHGNYAPGRRFYFQDFDGIEFEIVSYA